MEDTVEEVARNLIEYHVSAKASEEGITSNECSYLNAIIKNLQGSGLSTDLDSCGDCDTGAKGHVKGKASTWEYLQSDVPQSLWYIVCDPWLYEQFDDNPDVSEYLYLACWILSIIGHPLECQRGTYDEDTKALGASLIEPSTKLWKLLLQEHEEILHDIFRSGLDPGWGSLLPLRLSLSRLATMVSRLNSTCHNNRARYTLKEDYLACILLECVMALAHESVGLYCVYEFTYILRKRSKSDVRRFLKDNLGTTELVKSFMYAWLTNIKKPLLDAELSPLLELLALFQYSGTMPAPLEKRIVRDVPAVVAKVCKRQLCGGNNTHSTWDVLMHAINLLTLVFDVNERTVQEACDLMINISLIPIISRSLAYIASRPVEKNSIFVLRMPFESLALLLANASRQGENALAVRTVLATWWKPTLDELRALPRLDNPSRDVVIDQWIKFGRRVRMYEGAPPIPRPVKEDNEEYRFKYCHNEECLCNDRPGSHKLMVCRRCWRAMYCNANCQRKDWNAGHKEVCFPG